MKGGTLAVLAIVTAGAVGVAAWTLRARAPEVAARAGNEPALPGLAEKLDEVAWITIATTSGELVLKRERAEAGAGVGAGMGAEKSAARWVVESKGGYPARREAVREVLVGLSEMKLAEKKTARPEQFGKIGVQDLKAEGSASPSGGVTGGAVPATLVTLRDAKGQGMGGVILGKAEGWGERRTQFVRKPGELQSWLAEGAPAVNSDALLWVERKVLALPRGEVKRVTAWSEREDAGPAAVDEAPRVRVERASAEERGYAVAEMPAGRELKSENAPDALAMALSELMLEDVAKAADVMQREAGTPPAQPGEEGGAATPVRAEYVTFDGLVVTVRTMYRGGRWWATVEARAAEDAKDEAKKRAEELQGLTAGWAYAISEWTARALATTREDLLLPAAPGAGVIGPVPQSP